MEFPESYLNMYWQFHSQDMMHTTSQDTESNNRKISDLISQFMESLDRKDYVKLRKILNPEIHVDYSSFRAEKPGIISSEEFVNRRQSALANLDTQHLFSNLEIDVKEDEAFAKCDYHIARKQQSGSKEFNSEGAYIFTLVTHDRNWLISGIVQNHYRSVGDSEIHGATLLDPMKPDPLSADTS